MSDKNYLHEVTYNGSTQKLTASKFAQVAILTVDDLNKAFPVKLNQIKTK